MLFHKFGAVAVQPFPFLCATNAFIGDAVSAELICPDLRLHIGKTPAGRQGDEQHPISGGEYDAVCFVVVLRLTASITARSTAHQNCTIFGFD